MPDANGNVTNDELAALILQFQPLIKSFGESTKAWALGTVGGGPNGNGQYPLQTDFGTSILVPCPAQIASDALQPKFMNVKMTTGSTYPLDLTTHKSAIITLEGPAPTTNVTVQLPPNAPAGWTVTIIQNSSGRMTFSLNGGASMYNRQGYNRTFGQGSPMTALCTGRSSGNLSFWVLFGDMTV